MLEPLRRVKRLLQALQKTRDRAWAARAVRLGIDPLHLGPRDADGRVLHKAIGTRMRVDEGECLLAMSDMAATMAARGVRFEIDDRGTVLATTATFRTYLRTAEEVQILDEVVRAGAYNLKVAGDLLILDVGMNVGMAAMFFAAANPGAIVCGFEPFEKTRVRAQENFELNEPLAGRIRVFPFGLSDSDRVMQVEYSEVWRGSVGINGVPRGLRSTDRVMQEMCLRDSAVVVGQLMEEYPGRRVVMKVDCEGSEYEILRRLAAGGHLTKIDAIAMECHRRRVSDIPGELSQLLTDAGLSLVHLDPESPDISMIYAFRHRR